MNRELYLSSIAVNGSFALEYYLINEYKRKLLLNGIEYCRLMEDAAYNPSPTNIFENKENFEKISTIQKYHTHEYLLKYMGLAMDIRDDLLDILQKNKIILSEEKIRSYQHFFNETSSIFLGAEMQKLRIKRELKQKMRT